MDLHVYQINLQMYKVIQIN